MARTGASKAQLDPTFPIVGRAWACGIHRCVAPSSRFSRPCRADSVAASQLLAVSTGGRLAVRAASWAQLGLSCVSPASTVPRSRLLVVVSATENPRDVQAPPASLCLRCTRSPHVEGDARVPPRQAPPGLRRQRQQVRRTRHQVRRQVDRGDLQGGVRCQGCTRRQQHRPALQPHPLLGVDEEGRRRQEAARQAAGHGRQGPRRLRQDAQRLRAGGRDAVRLRLGLAGGARAASSRCRRRPTARTR